MFRMPQKLLIITLLFMFFACFGYAESWQLKKSVTTGENGIHLKNPQGLYLDSENNKIYIVDSGNDRLISYSFKTGKEVNFTAGGVLKLPVAMVKTQKYDLWIINRYENSLMNVNLKERKTVSKKLYFNGRELFLDKLEKYNDKLLCIDKFSGGIAVVNHKFKVKKIIIPNQSDFKGFFDIKVHNGIIYAMESETGNIFYFIDEKETGKINTKFKFFEPVSFDIDKNSNIYIVDRYLKKIFLFNFKGKLVNSHLKEGRKPGYIFYPWLIRVKGSTLYLLDEGNGRVDVFTF